jgi:transmembrane sensor
MTEEFGLIVALARLLIHLGALAITWINGRKARGQYERISETFQRVRFQIGRIEVSRVSLERSYEINGDRKPENTQVPKRSPKRNTPSRQRAPRRHIAAVAALYILLAFTGLLTAGLITAGYYLNADPQDVIDYLLDKSYETKIAEQQTVILPDGSQVRLNTNSKVLIHYTETERRVTVKRGEALITVGGESVTPFRVLTPEVNVWSTRAVFDVKLGKKGRTFVSVAEGQVHVIPRQSKCCRAFDTQLATGYRLVAYTGNRRSQHSYRAGFTSDGRALHGFGPSLEQVHGWPENKLIFDQQSLQEITDEFNRYNRSQVRITDPELAQCRLTLNFYSHDRQALFDYLAAYLGVEVSRHPDGSYSLRSGRMFVSGEAGCLSKEVSRYH